MASIDEKKIELERQVRLYLSNPNNMEVAAETVLNDLVDSVVLGIVFEVHRAAKIGLVGIEDGISDEVSQFDIIERDDVDIFGQQRPIKKPPECVCPSCKRSLGALRFAPHLEKCMERMASRRIANNNNNNNNSSNNKETVGYSGMMSDDDSEFVGSDRRRKKRDRNGTRRPKNQKTERNGDTSMDTAACSELSSSNMNYDGMSNDEKKLLLMQICGVISVNTRKLCTKSMRCPTHSDEQRRAVRAILLHAQGSEMNCGSDMLQVDVDSYEDGDGQNIRETLGQNWEQENSNTSSPADSASSSSSSKKKEKIPKAKKSLSYKGHFVIK